MKISMQCVLASALLAVCTVTSAGTVVVTPIQDPLPTIGVATGTGGHWRHKFEKGTCLGQYASYLMVYGSPGTEFEDYGASWESPEILIDCKRTVKQNMDIVEAAFARGITYSRIFNPIGKYPGRSGCWVSYGWIQNNSFHSYGFGATDRPGTTCSQLPVNPPVKCDVAVPRPIEHGRVNVGTKSTRRGDLSITCDKKTTVTVDVGNGAVLLRGSSGTITSSLGVNNEDDLTTTVVADRTATVPLISVVGAQQTPPGAYDGTAIVYVTWE